MRFHILHARIRQASKRFGCRVHPVQASQSSRHIYPRIQNCQARGSGPFSLCCWGVSSTANRISRNGPVKRSLALWRQAAEVPVARARLHHTPGPPRRARSGMPRPAPRSGPACVRTVVPAVTARSEHGRSVAPSTLHTRLEPTTRSRGVAPIGSLLWLQHSASSPAAACAMRQGLRQLCANAANTCRSFAQQFGRKVPLTRVARAMPMAHYNDGLAPAALTRPQASARTSRRRSITIKRTSVTTAHRSAPKPKWPLRSTFTCR
jgi:hypothetical protein